MACLMVFWSGENSSLRLTDTHSIVARLFSTVDCDIFILSLCELSDVGLLCFFIVFVCVLTTIILVAAAA